MNELELVEKAAKKLADLEKEQKALQDAMTKKASQEEIDTLKQSLTSVNESIEQMRSAIEAHTAVIENLQVTEQKDVPEQAQKNLELLEFFNKKHDKGLKKTFKTSLVELRKFVKKAITAPYANIFTMSETIEYINQKIRPGVVDIFLSSAANTGSIIALDFDVVNQGGGASKTQGCFLPSETDANLIPVSFTATTFRGFTKTCDTNIEDYNNLLDVIYDIMSQIVSNQVDTSIMTSLTSTAINNTALPSYTALASSVPECTFYDIVAIHTMDMFNISRGRYLPQYVILHPTDASRVLTSKISGSYVEKLMVEGFTMPKVFVSPIMPLGQFLLVDSETLRYHPVRGLEIEVATQNEDDFLRGILTFRASERGIIVRTNIMIYGSIIGTINSTITNFTAP